jgi:hypothetical protein
MANESAKALLLRRHGFATLCVQHEQLPYKYVTAEGPVEIKTLNEAERYEQSETLLPDTLGPKPANPTPTISLTMMKLW